MTIVPRCTPLHHERANEKVTTGIELIWIQLGWQKLIDIRLQLMVSPSSRFLER